MSAYFFDSSTIVKRYVNEPGSEWVAVTTNPAGNAHIYIASITGVEVVATFARKRKGKLVEPVAAAAAISLFHQHFANEYRIIEIGGSVISRSLEVADMHSLRGYDAVQLGAALELNRRRVALGARTRLTLVTGDGELLAAAVAEGLLTDNPDIH